MNSTYSFSECIRVLSFAFIIGLVASAGTYFVQFGSGWTYWAGWAVTGIFGTLYLALTGAFIFDILRTEYRIRTR